MGLLVFSIIIMGLGAGYVHHITVNTECLITHLHFQSYQIQCISNDCRAVHRKTTQGYASEGISLCYFSNGHTFLETLPSGEVVIRSPSVTIQSIYLWFYAAINFGSCGAISASFLARDNGYWAAFLVPTGVFTLVPLVLMFGKKHYVVTPPRGSVLLEVICASSDCLL